MSQKITDEEFEAGATKAHITGIWGHTRPLLEEARRARSEEARLLEENRKQAEQIKALADMLEGLWGLRDTSKMGLWRIELDDEEAAKVHATLRLAGRLP